MTYDLVFLPEAALDIQSNYFWYETKQKGLGDQLVNEIERTIDRTREHPLRQPVLLADVRRARVNRFHFVVYYLVDEHKVVIIAVGHQRRDRSFWLSRIPDQN
jgi:plasmid stabilization system protein ParE